MRVVLFGLLAIVAIAAAVLSFDALRSLALLAAFAPALAWLLPVVVDAGAAAGSLVWLSRPGGRAETFGRALALTLLGSSVAGNAVSHGLAAYGMRPPWWLVVLVSGIAPAVLGAVVHLAVLVGKPADRPDQTADRPDRDDDQARSVDTQQAPDFAPEPHTVSEVATDVPTEPDRSKFTDEQIISDARQWAVDLRRPASRDEMLTRYRIGAGRCKRIRERLGWADESSASPNGAPTGREAPTTLADRSGTVPTTDPHGAPE